MEEKMHTAELFNDLNDFVGEFNTKKAEADLIGPYGANPYLEAGVLVLLTALAQIRILSAQETMHNYLTEKTSKG